MNFREAIYSLKPTAITAMKIVGEAIIRTAIYSVVFIVVLISLKLYNTDHYLIYIGFIIGSLIANVSHVMKPYLNQKQLEGVRV